MTAFLIGGAFGVLIGGLLALLNGNVEYDKGFDAGRIRGAREVKTARPSTDRGSYGR